MAYPDDSQNDARHKDTTSHHQEKTNSHDDGNGNEDSKLCFDRHSFFLDKALQMFFVHLRPHKPVMEFL